jgi:hypothetical protein
VVPQFSFALSPFAPFALCALPFAALPLALALCPLRFAPLRFGPLRFALCALPFALCPLPFALWVMVLSGRLISAEGSTSYPLRGGMDRPLTKGKQMRVRSLVIAVAVMFGVLYCPVVSWGGLAKAQGIWPQGGSGAPSNPTATESTPAPEASNPGAISTPGQTDPGHQQSPCPTQTAIPAGVSRTPVTPPSPLSPGTTPAPAGQDRRLGAADRRRPHGARR